MMLATPPREQLMQALVPVLAGMNGYPYPNPVRVAIAANPFVLQNYQPFIAVIQTSGSSLAFHDHEGGEEDTFRFDVYGQIKATQPVTAREWVNNLFHDVTSTLRHATRIGGALYSIGCLDITFGYEDVGYDDAYGDFLLPCTARLRYVLAPW